MSALQILNLSISNLDHSSEVGLNSICFHHLDDGFIFVIAAYNQPVITDRIIPPLSLK